MMAMDRKCPLNMRFGFQTVLHNTRTIVSFSTLRPMSHRSFASNPREKRLILVSNYTERLLYVL